MLKAGYMEEWRRHQTYSGTVQGGVVSPILANIVLNELDQNVENELIPQFTRGKRRRHNTEWRRLSRQMQKARQAGNLAEYRQLEQRRRTMPSKDPHDDKYRRLRYCRYADDFILGFIGPKSEAEEIKAKIGAFLKRTKLTLSKDKTLITHAAKGKARFLGYEIYVAYSDNRLTTYQRGTMTLKKRALNGKVILNVPRDVATKWRARYTKNGKSIHRAHLLNSSDYEIVMTHNVEFQGLLNYYALAHNSAQRLTLVRYLCLQALVKTLAAKHKRTTSWVYRHYMRKQADGRKVIAVTVPRDPPKKPLIAIFGAHSFARNTSLVINDQIQRMYLQRTELVQRILSNECELCGATESIQVHHIRKLKDVRKKYRDQEPPPWAAFMLGKRRKTVVVCQACHHSIHAGTYDGPSLN